MLKPWQKWWVAGAALGALWHSLRDALQFAGVRSVIADSFVAHKTTTNLLWSPWNTVVIEVLLLVLLLIVWRRQVFGFAGWLSVALVFATGLGFGWYWWVVP